MSSQTHLKRSLSLPLLTFYGLGSIIGAGIYVLIGEVVGKAGMHAPLAFLLAAVIAGFTAFSYAELASRLPFSAGEALYVDTAFQRRWLSAATGWTVVGIGLVSSATIAHGFVGYLRVFVTLPDWLASGALILVLGSIAIWGITQSAWLALVTTLLEIGGLLFVLAVSSGSLGTLPQRLPELLPSLDGQHWVGIFLGAFLAFYAYIGFEDMVNVAEEVKDAPRMLPQAILIALVASTLLYVSVSLVAVLSVPAEELAASSAPLTTVLATHDPQASRHIGLISMLAVINGALVQIIMVSRVLYGMANKGLAPRWLAAVHPRTRTPLKATLLATGAIMALTLWLPLVTLAQITSLLTLLIFTAINLALIRIKRRNQPVGRVSYPLWVPIAGTLLSLIFIALQALSLT